MEPPSSAHTADKRTFLLSVLEGCFQDLVNGGINVLLGRIEINATALQFIEVYVEAV